MANPQITTKATNITVTPKLEELLMQKFTPLSRLLRDGIETRFEIELEKVGEHQSGKIFRAEANLIANGKLYRAEAIEEQIEQAIDRVRDELKHELQREHGKKQSLIKKGRQALKNMLRFGRGE
jgi:ribosomal subunit interface protein